MTDGKELFSRRLKEARERSGLSQRRLGILIGYRLPKCSIYINRWEREARMPKELETIEKLAKVLQVPTPYFFCEDEELAEMLIVWGQLDSEKRREALESLGTDQIAVMIFTVVAPTRRPDSRIQVAIIKS